MTEPLLQVDSLSVHCFTEAGVVEALDDVSFAVDRGEVLGLVGEAGSGKSLTGYSIMGLVDPPGRIMGGRIELAGQDLAAQSTTEMRQLRGNRMAMVFQDPMLSLNPVLRIEAQMLETILAHVETTRPAARARAREALSEVGIASPDAALKAYPHQFSVGMLQRVAIAIASVNRPDLLIADEPAAALDIALRGQIVFDTQKLTRETGAALIWITHDLARIAGLADRVCVMYAGRIVEQGATADVLSAPRHPYTRGLLDSMPGRVPPGEKLRQITGAMPSRAELPPGCAFRPRCPYATAACGETPDLRPYGAVGQSIRCFHPLHGPASM
jgi:peptide/nickel transport system ATP-binding protein